MREGHLTSDPLDVKFGLNGHINIHLFELVSLTVHKGYLPTRRSTQKVHSPSPCCTGSTFRPLLSSPITWTTRSLSFAPLRTEDHLSREVSLIGKEDFTPYYPLSYLSSIYKKRKKSDSVPLIWFHCPFLGFQRKNVSSGTPYFT